MILHGYWRSTAAYRARIALNLKGAPHTHQTHDLRRGAQRAPDFLALSPQGLVPALETHDGVLTQSLAIIEWLEETYPEPPLLPGTAADRAVVRAMAQLIACDIHPINNLRVLSRLRSEFGASEIQVSDWIGDWISEGFTALERLVGRHGGRFAFGDAPTLVDCCLVPQLYSAERFGVSLAAYPRLVAAGENARALEAVLAAHPDRQTDADAR